MLILNRFRALDFGFIYAFVWNSAAFTLFVVSSFLGVAEVATRDHNYLSLSFWYSMIIAVVISGLLFRFVMWATDDLLLWFFSRRADGVDVFGRPLDE